MRPLGTNGELLRGDGVNERFEFAMSIGFDGVEARDSEVNGFQHYTTRLQELGASIQ